MLSFFPSPAGMSLIKLSLTGNNLIIPGQGEFGSCHPGWGQENDNLFLTVQNCSKSLGAANDSLFFAYQYEKKLPINFALLREN
jgi:hypothetical protein